MNINDACVIVEYKLATESNRFADGLPVKIDIHKDWPDEYALSAELRKKYPYLSVQYDRQPNDILQLVLIHKKSGL